MIWYHLYRSTLTNTKCSGFSPGLVGIELRMDEELRVGIELGVGVGLVCCVGLVTSTGLGLNSSVQKFK